MPPAHLRVTRYLAIALIAGVLYTVLGVAVSHAPPFGIDLAGRALAGEAPQLALIFTESCWWMMLLALGILAILVAVRFPAWRARAICEWTRSRTESQSAPRTISLAALDKHMNLYAYY